MGSVIHLHPSIQSNQLTEAKKKEERRKGRDDEGTKKKKQQAYHCILFHRYNDQTLMIKSVYFSALIKCNYKLLHFVFSTLKFPIYLLCVTTQVPHGHFYRKAISHAHEIEHWECGDGGEGWLI